MRRPRPTTVLTAVGVLLVLTGVALIAGGPPVAYGWYDTAGGSVPADPLGDLVVLSSRQHRGQQLVALGLVVVAASVGYALGRRRR